MFTGVILQLVRLQPAIGTISAEWAQGQTPHSYRDRVMGGKPVIITQGFLRPSWRCRRFSTCQDVLAIVKLAKLPQRFLPVISVHINSLSMHIDLPWFSSPSACCSANKSGFPMKYASYHGDLFVSYTSWYKYGLPCSARRLTICTNYLVQSSRISTLSRELITHDTYISCAHTRCSPKSRPCNANRCSSAPVYER